MTRTPLRLVTAAVALAGCTMIPKYNRPDLPVPASWPESAAVERAEPGARAATEVGWKA